MAFGLFHGGAAQRDLLVQHDIVADLSRGSHHDAVGVVNEKPAPDLCRRVDLNPGQRAHGLGQNARGHFPAWHFVEFVQSAVCPHGVQAGVADRGDEVAAHGGVAPAGGVQVFA